MTQSISAAIHIQGPTIRCAEIGREDSALQLRRLDSRTVDLNGSEVLWDADGAPDALDRVGAFAQDALEGTEALATALIIHPLEVYSFFVPIPTGLSEQERGQRVAYQAALVTNTRSPLSSRRYGPTGTWCEGHWGTGCSSPVPPDTRRAVRAPVRKARSGSAQRNYRPPADG